MEKKPQVEISNIWRERRRKNLNSGGQGNNMRLRREVTRKITLQC